MPRIVELTEFRPMYIYRRTGSHDRMLCRYVRVRFSGNVSLVQMFIKPVIYVRPITNNVQLQYNLTVSHHKVNKFQILACWFSPTATASEQNPRQTWQPHLAIATNTNCGDFIGIHYINIINNQSRNPGIGLKKIPGFRIEKLTGIPRFLDPGIPRLKPCRFLWTTVLPFITRRQTAGKNFITSHQYQQREKMLQTCRIQQF